MAGKLGFFFDEKGDVLDISIGRPKKAVTKELKNDIAIRVDPKTNKIIGFTILNFTKRFKASKKSEEIPITATMSVVKE